MKTLIKTEMILGIVMLLTLTVPVSGSLYANMDTQMDIVFARQTPRPPAQAFDFSIFHTAPLQVALVFGRSAGCSDAKPELINNTARAAIDAGVDPGVYAATVATESACNPLAISSRGAVGLSGIMIKTWKDRFDFSTVNLFNPTDNLRVGAQIEAQYIQQYGLAEGIHHYNGMGVGCETCDAGYVSKILLLAGRRQ